MCAILPITGNESPDAKYVVGSNINDVYLISTILFVVVPVVVETKSVQLKTKRIKRLFHIRQSRWIDILDLLCVFL